MKQSDDIDYFRRMGVEPSAYGILRWIDNNSETDNHKYARRMIESLIRLCGGDPLLNIPCDWERP
jgi:hypothetical protein